MNPAVDAGLPAADAGHTVDAGTDAGVVAFCATWSNWTCQGTASGLCLATCRADAGTHQVACDSVKCARATSATSSELCPAVNLTTPENCGSCQKAVESGCY